VVLDTVLWVKEVTKQLVAPGRYFEKMVKSRSIGIYFMDEISESTHIKRFLEIKSFNESKTTVLLDTYREEIDDILEIAIDEGAYVHKEHDGYLIKISYKIGIIDNNLNQGQMIYPWYNDPTDVFETKEECLRNIDTIIRRLYQLIGDNWAFWILWSGSDIGGDRAAFFNEQKYLEYDHSRIPEMPYGFYIRLFEDEDK